MDSSSLYLVVKNFTNLTPEEGSEVRGLTRQYPYSQLLHLIHARASKDLNDKDQVEVLHHSAVYSTDRAVLKWIMTSARIERVNVEAPVSVMKVINEPEPEPQRIETVAENQVEIIAPVAEIPVPKARISDDNFLTGDALRNDIYHELERLQKLKHDFELSFDEFQRVSQSELDEKRKVRSLKETTGEPLLDEIKTTKKKLKVDNPRQKEQNEIIDQFIKTQPIIPRTKAVEDPDDLAEDSGMFSDNIVSETLVDILLKQGKKDKAIEVLKKLIWKFPQKKTYFAAQIESLKN